MAPKKGKETLLDLCTRTTALGNTIAVHILEYLNLVKQPPHRFQEVAIELLDVGRILLPVKAGLASAPKSSVPIQSLTGPNHDLAQKLQLTQSTFIITESMVKKFLEGESKHGLGKLSKGFRMMFADSEVEKLRSSLARCRETLAADKLVFSYLQNEYTSDPIATIGYTALGAVLDHPEPEKQTLHSKTAPSATIEPPLDRAVPIPTVSASDLFPNVQTMPDHGAKAHGLVDVGLIDRERSSARQISGLSGSSKGTSASHAFSSGSSVRRSNQDNLSEITRMSSIVLPSHHSEAEHKGSEPALRMSPDSNAAPRWIPKRYTGAVSTASKTALVTAVQQKNSRVVEQLLDSGVPPDNGPELSLLREAIINRDLDTVRLLLLFGADANLKDRHGFTPLYAATDANFFEAAQLLVRYGADPNISAGPDRETPLANSLVDAKALFTQLYLQHGASSDMVMENGNTAFVQAFHKDTPMSLIDLMLLYEPDVNRKNGRGETALFKAINAGRLDLVTILLDHGADPDLPAPKHMLWPSVHNTEILELVLERGANLQRAPGVLELATSINSVDAVTILLKHGADPNAKKDGIFTPLCTAIRDDHRDLVDILLAAGADPNLQASEFPAFKCVTHHRAHLLPRLLAAGSNPNVPKGIIEMCVAHSEQDALKFLLEHGVDPNARNASGCTALTTAIRQNKMDFLDILLAHGANPGVRGSDWPVSLAVKQPEILAKLLPHIEASKINKGVLEMSVVANQIESVKMLLAKGMDVEEKNGGVFSPLTTSIREDRKDIFRYLIDEAGADPNAPGEHLPIIKAIRRHRENDLTYIEHLLSNGADINLMYRGWNAVLQALDNGDLQILRLLAEKGNPDLSACDENGRSVLEIMQDRGLQEEEQILMRARSPSPEMKAALSSLRGLVVS